MKKVPSSRGHRYVAIVSTFLIVLTMIASVGGMVGCFDVLPHILPHLNLEIRTWYDLDLIRDNWKGHHRLMNDLDSTTPGYVELASPTANEGRGWSPIMARSGPGPLVGLAGSFDGQGHEIRDLYVLHDLTDYYIDHGLFGCVEEGGRIENLGVVNASVSGGGSVGGLVGYNGGTVRKSYFTGNVTGRFVVGGLVGHCNGAVINSYSIADVTGRKSVGGLVGLHAGTVRDSYSAGSVTGNESVGGLVGDVYRTVSNSYYNYDDVLINGQNVITVGALCNEDFEQWLANDKTLDVNKRLSTESGYYSINDVADLKQLLVFGQDDSLRFRLNSDLDLASEPNFYIPYLAGEFDGNGHIIANLSFDFGFVSQVGLFGYLAPGGKISRVAVENARIAGGERVGGLAGETDGTVSDCYAAGSVSGQSDVGGLVGINSVFGTVSNSYSGGSVTGTDAGIGGLVGANHNTVSNSYSFSDVFGGDSVGGLVGWNAGTIENCYATGRVTGESDVGGLAGYHDGSLSNCFWDIQTSGQATSGDGTGKTTAEMKKTGTFSDAGWDIAIVADSDIRNTAYSWNIVSGQTYPFLSWQA